MNWSSLIVFFVLGVLGLWVAYSFLNRKGLYIFSLLAIVCSAIIYPAEMFSQPMVMGTVLMPLAYLAILTCYNKYGKEEAKKLFFSAIIVQVTLFVVYFLQNAYLDVSFNTQTYLSWEGLGSRIFSIVSFVVACIVSIFFMEKVELKTDNKIVKNAVYLAVASIVDSFVFVLFTYIGVLSFGAILLVLLIRVVLQAAICAGLGYFEKFLNRQFAVKVVDNKAKTEEAKEENKEETKKETEEKAEKPAKKENKKVKDDDENINYENI
ncbi:MAG: VUT family protein [Clostridia bacterium]|nr:VUT family protein [Clostridia bacterium]